MMTDPNTETPGTTETPDATETPEQQDVSTVEREDNEQQSSNREAARYRRQLRDAEAERDSLRERVLSYERAEVERLAADKLADPTDLWTGGVELDSLRDKSGAIDPAKVVAAAGKVLEDHPHWQRPQRPRPSIGNLKSGAWGGENTAGSSWADAFARARGK
ncbi:hypothetical protein [Nocardia farcinica]|uniref:hypothetical protein n=1 Tax=Nocardia farcinica TaxID=37329 RepID=UPI0015F0581E|nr:hypothetical protein [Nocardia farcinica]MBA4855775.1 hypothetical protein [Nocardia farcinica]MBC9815741.1 hypothetical protein [Nocardia farcinica]MBF6407476.1 hypothetical protein [Nocardia farcinica]